jgi:hypothetical protein
LLENTQMKRIYIQFLLILLVSTFNIDLQAQRLNIPEKSTIGDEFLIAPDGTYSELRPDLSGNCGCEISDLSFNWSGSFEAAIANENLIRLARKRTLKKWYTNQINKVVKPAIEYKLNLKFPSYSEAKTALFKYSERGNISRNLPITKRNLEKKVSVNQSRQQKYLKDLKILNIREAEISSGNITSSEFGYYKVNGIDLRNIKTISDLNKTKKTINSQFESNHIELFKNNLIYKKAKSLNYWSIEKEVISKKHNYYNSFNEWDRLNLMQLLVHYEQYKQLSNCMVCLQPESFTKFKGLDIGTTEFITAYATKNKGGGMSVFHKDYWREILYKEYKEKTIYKYNPSLFMQHFIVLTNAAQKEHKKRKKEELNKLLNSTSTADFAITNLIGELNITNNTQKNWLYEHKTAANKLIKFIDNNKVNNKVTDKAKTFAVEAIKSLMNNYIKLDINKLIEVLKFEQDYKNRMSSSEKVIFESISRNNQLGYLFNAQKAIWKAEELFPNSLYNGKGDAFRHAYFNGLNAILLGNTLAESLATAHEDRTAPVGYSNYYKEKQMDLFNNQIGRDRKNWLFDGYSSLTKSILDALKTGKLRYLSNLKGGAASGRATNLSKLTPTNK